MSLPVIETWLSWIKVEVETMQLATVSGNPSLRAKVK